MPRKIYESWITIRAFSLPGEKANACQAAILNCGNCHQDMQVMLPMEINNLWALSSAFGNIHNQCEEEDA